MKRLKRILKIVGWVVLAMVIGVYIFAHTLRFRLTDDEFSAELVNPETSIDISYIHHEKGEVRTIRVNRGRKDLLILLHGSPSSSAQWVPMVKDSLLSQRVDFLLIDRPGYGFSNFGKPELSVQKVAQIIKEASDQYKDTYDRLYVLGTSYGGTVAARLLMDYPGYFAGAMLVSSSLAPGEERTYPISYFMDRVPWLFPTFLMVANDEKLDHEEQLKTMLPYWEQIQDPLFIMHSTTDDLVYPTNVDFALQRLNSSVSVHVLWVPNAEHSMFWSDRALFFENVHHFLDGPEQHAALHP